MGLDTVFAIIFGLWIGAVWTAVSSINYQFTKQNFLVLLPLGFAPFAFFSASNLLGGLCRPEDESVRSFVGWLVVGLAGLMLFQHVALIVKLKEKRTLMSLYAAGNLIASAGAALLLAIRVLCLAVP